MTVGTTWTTSGNRSRWVATEGTIVVPDGIGMTGETIDGGMIRIVADGRTATAASETTVGAKIRTVDAGILTGDVRPTGKRKRHAPSGWRMRSSLH